MRKVSLLSILLLCVYFSTFAQDTDFKFSKEGLTDFVVTSVDTSAKELFAKTEDKEIQILVQKYSSQKKWGNALGIGGLFLLAGGIKASIDRNGSTTIYEKIASLSGGICLGLGISLNKKSSKKLNTAVGLYNFEQKKEMGFVSELFIPEIKYTIKF